MPINNERGIALLLVLWIITLLAVICAEFSWTMRTEISIATHFKEGEQAYYTAEAGINRAIIELMRSRNSKTRTIAQRGENLEEEEEEDRTWRPGAGPFSFEFEQGRCEVVVEDEGNKIGLNPYLRKNKSNPGNLKALLQEKVGLEGEKRDIVADSMIDWWDKDSNRTGVNGAEDDYYESLEPPYESRDANFPIIEELLLVRGIDEKIFYGATKNPEQKTTLTREELERILRGETIEEDPIEKLLEEDITDLEDLEDGLTGMQLGLSEIFSVGSGSSTFKVNVNTATLEQLMLLRGMDISTAREIIEERKQRNFESKTDRLTQYANYEVWKKDIKVGSRIATGFYRIVSTGYSADGRISRSISCNMRLTSNRCIITNWKAIN